MWTANAELVAFGIGEGGPRQAELGLVMNVRGPERDNSGDFARDVVGVANEHLDDSPVFASERLREVPRLRRTARYEGRRVSDAENR